MRNRRAGRHTAGQDAGITLVEVVVSMSLMAVFMAMFTTTILGIFRMVNRNDATSTAQSQVNIAFLRLDKEIRYAAGISVPGSVGTDPHVEYVTTNTGTPVCTQLRLHLASQQLQRRTWTSGSTPVTPTAWIPLASNVGGAQPFTFSAAGDTFNFQRLRLTLIATAGGGSTAASRQTEITFTALNTTLGTSSADICTEGRSIP